MIKAGASLYLAIGLALSVGGCSGHANDAGVPLKWAKLSDGSWLSNSITASNFNEVTRCWPSQSGFDCLDVFVGGGSIMPSRFASNVLPKVTVTRTAGYACQLDPATRLMHESISGTVANGSAATLKSHSVNVITDGNSLWTRGEVNRFMAANHVSGSPHYDCPYVAKLVSEGSYLSIGTTDLSYRQFLGLDNPENPIILRDPSDPLSVTVDHQAR